VKIKFHDFQRRTAESIATEINLQLFESLFQEIFEQENKAIRLIGLGVHFNQDIQKDVQKEFDF
jgi:hypothetical protein